MRVFVLRVCMRCIPHLSSASFLNWGVSLRGMTFPRVGEAFQKCWQNPSLLGVLLLEFLFSVVLGILFFIVDALILASMNQTAFDLAQPNFINWQAFLNTETIIVAILLIVVEGFLFVYLDSFFKSGFFGMCKNLVQDGSTTFQEFLPSAKRYWHPMFRLLLVRNLLLLIFLIPLVFAGISYLGTTPQFVTPGQAVFFFTTLAIFLIASAIIFLLFFYAEAVVVFRDQAAILSIKESVQLVRSRFGPTFLAFALTILIIVLGGAIESLFATPIDMVASTLTPETSIVLVGALNFLRFTLNIVSIIASVIASVYIFLTYRDLTSNLARRPTTEKTVVRKTVVQKRRK
jgi:hypothetical protein